jgi:hypothetical protein
LWQGDAASVLSRKESTVGWTDHIDDGRGPSPPIYIDGIIAMLKKEGWIEDKTFIPWTGTDGSQDGVCRFTKAGEGHDVEIIRYYPKYESPYYEAVSVPKMR